MRRLTLFVSILALVAIAFVAGPAAQSQAKPPAAKAATTSGSLVNLNTASEVQLTTLPGIGPATAKRIVEHRQKNGSFKKIEELMNVKGIGEKSFLKLKPLVTVGTEKTDRAGGGQ
jgi:competence protein ComEA